MNYLITGITGFAGPNLLIRNKHDKKIRPDILLLGDDWKDKKIIGKNLVKKIVFFKRIKKYSTTGIISKIEKK